MNTFEFDSIEESYQPLLKSIVDNGNEVCPRNLSTLELSPVAITIHNPRKNVISNKARKLNYGFMNGEFIWIMTGSNDLSITHYNKNWNNFSDDGQTLNGAYGNRIFNYPCKNQNINQFDKVFNLLKNDKFSRQATIVLFNPELDDRDTKDKPCTNLLRFSIRNDKLNMITFMRSNDIMFGYPYDVYNFTNMQAVLASLLEVQVGTYTHMVDSFHLYMSQIDWIKDIINEKEVSIYNKDYASNIDSHIVDNIQGMINVENSTRTLGKELELSTVETMLKSIKNDYWKSNSALLALYNFRKARRSQNELDILSSYINNEFKNILGKLKTAL